MSKVSIVAKLVAADGKEAELSERLLELIAAAEEEAGLEIYSVHADPTDPMSFTFFELYTNQAAFETHGKGPRMQQAMAALGGLLAGRPEVFVLAPIAAKGLEL